MAFPPLAFRHQVQIPGAPQQWLPLIHCFDPDLPLFPLQYFHVLRPNAVSRPALDDRAYGYIQSLHFDASANVVVANIVCNQDLSSAAGAVFRSPVEAEVLQRIGAPNRVTRNDILAMAPPPHTAPGVVPVLNELWHRVVARGYGDALPFGRLVDPVFGLMRFYASWNPPSGRKAELVQLHYFVSKFGERVQSIATLPNVDFYLFPTWQEFTDTNDPLGLYPEFSQLVNAAINLCGNEPGFQVKSIANWSYTSLQMPRGTPLSRESYFAMVRRRPTAFHRALTECFNAFDKGASRTTIFLMALNDYRQINSTTATPAGSPNPRLNPAALSVSDCAATITGMTGHQSPKVTMIIAQQCHANPDALPIDTWVGAFLEWPFAAVEYDPSTGQLSKRVANAPRKTAFLNAYRGLGKAERLIWVAAQARKVHASVCNDILWCIKGSRGANPLACAVCNQNVRAACPAFAAIATKQVVFNRRRAPANSFSVITDQRNNASPGQKFVSCTGSSVFATVTDEETPTDASFRATFPAATHVGGGPLTVAQFVATY